MTIFLRQLFANDEKLRRQFFEFSKPKTKTVEIVLEEGLIEKTAERLNKKLSKLSDLDPNDFYSSQGYGRYNDYYDDDGEGVQEWMDEKIAKVFTPFETEVQQYVQNAGRPAFLDELGKVGLHFK
jgi:hypothetical protein